MDEDGRWPELRTVVRAETSRPSDKEQPVGQQRYYISSRVLTPAQADGFVRGHWAIENALPWQLNVTFGEDHHCAITRPPKT